MLDIVVAEFVKATINSLFRHATTPPQAPGPYDAEAAFRADVIDSEAPAEWLSDRVVQRAITLAREQTGVAPDRGNAGGQALMHLAILGRKLTRGSSLTDEERQIVELLTKESD